MKKLCSLILTLLMLLMLALPGFAAEDRYYPLTETGTEGGFYYACQGIRFFSSVGIGERQYGEVTLRTAPGCSLYIGDEELTPEFVSGGEKTYVFAESGSYSITVRGEESGGVIPYSTFSFSVRIVNTQYASGDLDFGEEEPVGTLYTVGTGTYITDIINGETRSSATAIYFTEDLEVSYTRDGGPSVKYSSGAGLSGTGSYVFTISGKEENGMPVSVMLRFTIRAAVEPEPEIGQREDLLGPAPGEDDLADYSENADSGYVPGGDNGWSGDAAESVVNREVDAGKQEDSSGGGYTPKPEDGSGGSSSGSGDGGSTGGSGSSDGGSGSSDGGSGSSDGGSDDSVTGDYVENGITVVEVRLQETWYAQYGQYSQQVRNLYFYTNVANGGIIGEPVWFEIPDGLSAAMSDSSGSRPLSSGERFSEADTYILTVDERVGDVIYRGKLSFRILPAQSTPEPEQPQPDTAGGIRDTSFYYVLGTSFYVDEPSGSYIYVEADGRARAYDSLAAAEEVFVTQQNGNVLRYEHSDSLLQDIPHFCLLDSGDCFYWDSVSTGYYWLYRDGELRGISEFGTAENRLDDTLANSYVGFLGETAMGGAALPPSDPVEPGGSGSDSGSDIEVILPEDGSDDFPFDTDFDFEFDWSDLEDDEYFQYYDNLSEEELLKLLQDPDAEDEDFSYEIPIDWETEDVPAGWLMTYTGIDQQYDRERGQFALTTNAGYQFYSSIPNGAISGPGVFFYFPTEASYTLYQDGEARELAHGEALEEPGEYLLVFEVASAEAILKGYAAPRFSFRIVGSSTGVTDYIYAPYGYEISQVTLDSDTVRLYNDYYLPEEDGVYQLSFRGLNGEPEYMLSFRRDTEAPQFRLEGVTAGVGKSSGVSVSYLSEDAVLTEVYVNGNLTAYTGLITDTGDIEVRVYDEAGNFSSQSFEMKLQLNFAAILAALMVLALVAAAVFMVRYTRRKMTVR